MLVVRDQQMQALRSSDRPLVVGCPHKDDWIEIRLVDKWDEPVPNEKFEIALPDGSVVTGTLDEEGKARFEHILAGQCKVRFPEVYSGDRAQR